MVASKPQAVQHLSDHLPFHLGRGGDSHEGHMANVLPHVDSVHDQQQVLIARRPPPDQKHQLDTRCCLQVQLPLTLYVLLDHVLLLTDLLCHGRDRERRQLTLHDNPQVNVKDYIATQSVPSYIRYLGPCCWSRYLGPCCW